MITNDPHALWRVQLALECKAFDHDGRLVTVPCANPDPLHTAHVVRYCDGSTELAFAATAPGWFIRQLSGHNVDEMINQPALVAAQILGEGHAVDTDHFHTYCFDKDSPAAEPPTITQVGPEAYSIVIGGQSVASASSSRSDDDAAELWIETDAAHRRHGYATGLAQAWADGVRQAGKVAFYSHLHDNAGSAALARRLNVRPLFEIVAFNLR